MSYICDLEVEDLIGAQMFPDNPELNYQVLAYIGSQVDDHENAYFICAKNEQGNIIGIAGIRRMGYIFGEWGLWVTEELINKNHKFFYKSCKEWVDKLAKSLQIYYVLALVSSDSDANNRFVQHLGFNKIATVKSKYSMVGKDCILYQREVK